MTLSYSKTYTLYGIRVLCRRRTASRRLFFFGTNKNDLHLRATSSFNVSGDQRLGMLVMKSDPAKHVTEFELVHLYCLHCSKHVCSDAKSVQTQFEPVFSVQG